MKPFILTLSHSRFRFLMPIPMISQMLMLLFMAVNGRPAAVPVMPDWLIHLIVYAVLTVLTWIAYHGILPSSNIKSHLFLSCITAGTFGLLDELLQLTTIRRCCDPSDLAADIAGVLFGLIGIRVFFFYAKESLNEE